MIIDPSRLEIDEATKLLTVDEAAKIAHVSPSTIRNWATDLCLCSDMGVSFGSIDPRCLLLSRSLLLKTRSNRIKLHGCEP